MNAKELYALFHSGSAEDIAGLHKAAQQMNEDQFVTFVTQGASALKISASEAAGIKGGKLFDGYVFDYVAYNSYGSDGGMKRDDGLGVK
jgi:hypothetical protein